jgi:Domain of unknown function (DUF5078)
VNIFRFASAACLATTLWAGALATSGVAFADDPDAVPAGILNTNCSLDQLMAATKVVNPVAYGEMIGKYDSEPPWLQGAITNHLNMLLAKDPQDRQVEVDRLATIFPDYVPLFLTAEPIANQVVAKCPIFPAADPSVWNPAAPAPAPAG